MKTIFGLLLLFIASQAAGYSFYISNYKIYGSEEEASFSFYDYQYHSRNNRIDAVQFVLYRVRDKAKFFEDGNLLTYGQNMSDSVVKTLEMVKHWNYETQSTYNNIVTLGKLPEGVYVVEAIVGTDIAQIPVIISDYSLIVRNSGQKAVTFMSHRKNGISVKGYKSYAISNNNTMLKPIYYKNATSVYDVSSLNNQYSYNLPVVAIKGDKVAVNQSYYYNYYNYNNTKPNQVGYIFTDRSAYRPEQVVKFKGVFRTKDGFGYKVDKDSVTYAIFNSQNEEIAKKVIGLNKDGAFNDSIFIQKSWKLGEYTIKFNTGRNNYWYYNQNKNVCKFKVEEYKKPEYEVAVKLDKTQYQSGDVIEAEVSADYFFGAPVTNATVQYKVVAEPFYVPWYYYYRYYSWYEDLYGSQYNYGYQQVLEVGNGELDKDGKLKITYKSENRNQQNFRYTILAEVTDASRRVISGSSNAIVSYTAFTLSANTQKYYYKTDEAITVELNALDFSKNRIEETVRMKLYKYEYDKQYWRRGKEKMVLDTTVRTDKDMETIIDLANQGAGHYYVKLEAEDSRNHKITQNVSAYVIDPSRDNYYWWAGQSRGSIQIMTEKNVYKSGETMNALVYLPHEADVLISVNNKEFAHFDSYSFSGSDKGSFKSISVPIDEDAYGRMEIFVAYNHEDRYYSHKHDISIIPENKYLNVEIEFDEDEYRPGTTATALVTVKDHKGRPIPYADVTLSTADEAIYSLYPDLNKDINSTFYNTQVHNYYYNYQNQFSRYAYGRKMPFEGLAWRNQAYDIDPDFKSYLNNNNWYYYAYQTSSKENPVIRGFIVDQKTGSSLANAKVVLGKRTFTTKENGYFELAGFKLSHTSLEFLHGNRKTVLSNLPLYAKSDVDLIIAIPTKGEKEISLTVEPTITTLDDQRVLNNAEILDLNENVTVTNAYMTSDDAVTLETTGSVAVASFSGGSSRSKSLKRESAKVAEVADMAVSDEESEMDMAVPGEESQKPLAEPAKTRSDFKDAIYWNPNLKTDSRGVAKVKIKLPDNLTTWRTTAKVITNRTEVGQSIAKTIVTKNLLVRMETPRFITLGDEMLIATTVHNYLDSDKEVTVELQANGLSIDGTRQQLHVEANDDKRVDWKVNTKYITEKATLTVKALTR